MTISRPWKIVLTVASLFTTAVLVNMVLALIYGRQRPGLAQWPILLIMFFVYRSIWRQPQGGHLVHATLPGTTRAAGVPIVRGDPWRSRIEWRILLSGAAAPAALIVAAGAVALVWPLIRHSAYEVPGAGLTLLPTLAILISVLHWIWNRPALEVATYASLLGAFICLWIGVGEGEAPLKYEQWQLLGGTLLVAAAAMWWRQQPHARS